MNFEANNAEVEFAYVWAHKWRFFATFFLVFLLSYTALVAIDFVPEPVTEKAPSEGSALELMAEESALPAASVEEPILPTSIYIKKLDKTITVLNPDSRAIVDLDNALLNGVVRHPDSAKLAQDGNVFILGHSSYLPHVVNKNFQAFNGIQELAWGDTIEISSGKSVHVFEVEKVYKATAEDLTVPIAGDDRRLTLATCNSFGSKDDRFIVEAKEVSVRSL